MSDFDEEAERERLREQYEREQQKREATEHMSDLLLKGATMTDAHCDTCGDPIFRYDGQTFCPTCKQEVDPEGTADAQADEASAQSAAESTAEAATGDGSDEQAPETQTTQTESTSDEGGWDPSTATAGRDQRRSTPETAERDAAAPTERVEVPAVAPDSGPDPSRSASESPGDLHDARDALETTLVTFAQQAAATDDPRRARDALEAAREAADALTALDQVR